MTSTIASNPDWWPHRYDPNRDAVHYIPASRDDHRAAVFLTDEYLKGAKSPKPVARREAVAAQGAAAPMHFIFHSAFCCSTLLARAFDLPGLSMGLKEPVIFNDIAGWKNRGARPEQIVAVMTDALRLLARPFEPGETLVVKPSNLINGYAPLMLKLLPEAHALLLHAPLPVFLASIARKGMWGRLWVRDLMVKQLRDGLIQLGFQGEDYLGLTDLQAAAVGWLAQQALFVGMSRQFGARVRTLDSETLVASPDKAMTALAALFQVPLGAEAVKEIVEGPVFNRHSKSDTAFGADERASERESGEALHADEIEKVTVWAAAVAKNAGVPLTLPSALI
ncbi:hypothetical protein [Gimibacter soli]|uniref:Uncharacterized protein n=1 Tax=Gimibacter soli TaxID=3024400 RepID=A0AAE9XRY1_9PROT|nr:hypothetical protein [Gimibacter soli]WCL54141.1 hypothetical protein PH603_00020 [Gimibacter soli]